MSVESWVQLLVDGAGKKMRTFRITSPGGVDASGNAAADNALHQQVTTLADGRGDEVKSGEVLTELQAIHEALDLIAMRLD